MKKFILFYLLLLALQVNLWAQVKTVGTNGADYPTLNEAFFDINNGLLTGAITLRIIDNITESVTAELFESGNGSGSSYSSITIYPTGSGFTIDGDIDGPLISLNGAANITLDGRVGASGTTSDLVITNVNTGTSASTIQFTESATSNTIKYCIIKGSETAATSGIIFFSTAATGTGNDGITIDNCRITHDAAGRPMNAIFSSGTSGRENSGNTISNNNIYDFLNTGVTSNGINLGSFTTGWTISGNSFYETTSFVPTGGASPTFYGIQINNTSGTGFSITGNFIGGSSSSCGGTWTKTNARNNVFYAIYLNVGTGSASNVQNNTIKNFSWANSGNASWTGIHVAGGNVNIGTTAGNTIGAASGTGSVTVTGTANNTNVYGINIAGGGTVDCRNNTIGSVTAANSNSTNATYFFGINKSSTAGTTTINNNTIGSTTTPNSINASSNSTGLSSAQSVYGISNAGTGSVTIGSNTIANMTNGTTNSNTVTAGLINGISSTDGINTISDNTIHDLTIANANSSITNTASVCGISLTGTTLKTISGNTIYNLNNTFSSFSGSVIGLYFTGNTGANAVSENFIHSLSVTGGSSTSASIYGIQISAGATTYSNNIISLGGNTQTTVYGIYETGTAGNNNSLYFNTVYIGGSLGSGATNMSYGLFSAVNTNTRNFRNNILVNARSTTAGSDLHYAMYIVSTGGSITCDYNDYYVSGTGGTLGFYGANKTALPIVTGQDTHSVVNDPLFANPGGPLPFDYMVSEPLLVGVSGTGILFDYNGSARVIPTMGAFEIGCVNPTLGGTIATDQSGCTPFNPAAFTSTALPTGHTGTLEYKWQNKVGAGSWTDIPGSNSSAYDDPGPLTQTTKFKRIARVSCMADWTGAVESNEVTVTVNPAPTANDITGGNALCIGSTLSLTSNGSGTPSLTYTWASTNNGVATVTIAGMVTGVSAGAANITYIVTDGNTCKDTSAAHPVTVNPFPATGLAVGGPGTICSGSSANITVALSELGVNYQLRDDNGDVPDSLPVPGNGGTVLLPSSIMTFNKTFNVLATNATGCSAELTQKPIVTIDPPSAGGSIAGSATVCTGINSTTLTLSGHVGSVVKWQYSTDNWATPVDIVNTTTTQTATNLTITTKYRAVVQSGVCGAVNSTDATVTVNPASVGGSIAGSATVCTGTNSTTLTLSGHIGSVVKWQYSTDNWVTPVDIVNTTTTQTATNLTTTTKYRAVVKSGVCSAVNSTDATVTVSPVSVGGNIAGSATVCAGINSTILTLSGHIGSVVKWQYSTDNWVTPVDIVNTTTTQTATDLTTTTKYRAVVQSGVCTAVNSADATVTVNPASVGGTIAGSATVCTGTNSTTLTLSGHTGNVVKWQYSTDNWVTPVDIVNTTTTQTATNLTTTTKYRAVVQSGVCTSVNSADATVTVSPASVGGSIAGSATVCTGTNNTTLTLSGHIGSVVKWQYSIDNWVTPVDIVNTTTTQTATNLTITTKYRAVVQSGVCTAVNSAEATVTVDPAPVGGSIAGSATVCTGTNSTTLTLSGQIGTVVKWQYSTDNWVTPVDIVNTTTTQAATNLTTTTKYRAVVQSGVCAAVNSTEAMVTVNPASVGGSIAGSTTVCTGTNSSTLTLSGHIGSVVKWQYSTDNWVTPVDIVNTTTTQTSTDLTTTTKYRAVVQSGVCAAINSADATVTVSPASVGGSISGGTSPITYGSSTGTMTLTGYTGIIQRWEKRFNSGSWTIIPNSNPTYSETPSSSGTWGYRAVVKSGSCAEDNSTELSIVVNNAPLTITADNKSKVYDGLVFSTFTVTFNGFVNGETPGVLGGFLILSGTAATAINAGTYIITPGGWTSGNYTITFVDGQLIIYKPNLTFTADNKTKLFLAQNPVLTYTISGFVNAESQSVLDVLPAIQTTAVQNSPAGSYPITISVGSDNNYNYIYVPGTLTITKLSQVITFTDIPEKLLVKDFYTLAATSTSGLTVLFESMDTDLATVSGDQLTGVSKGNVQIRAYNPGDQNNNAAEAFATVEVYSTHKDIVHLFTPNGDGFNDYWELPDLAAWGKCDVKVYNRWGKLVFADPNYNNLWDGTSNGSPLPEGPYYFVINTENAGTVTGTLNIVR